VEGLRGGGSSGAARLVGGGADVRVVGGESRGAHHRSIYRGVTRLTLFVSFCLACSNFDEFPFL
jgi:hypothetical protein